MNIAIAGMGYVGMSLAVLLAQHNHVTAADILPERVSLINEKKSSKSRFTSAIYAVCTLNPYFSSIYS